MNILLLGSSSQARKKLLEDAKIPFICVDHTANEDLIIREDLYNAVSEIALLKMKHVVVPHEWDKKKSVYILTADTMGMDKNGIIHGKPKSLEDAILKLKACSDGVLTTATGFCIEKRFFDENINEWVVKDCYKEVVTGECIFQVPDNWIDRYFQNSSGLFASGAVAIELYGYQFMKTVNGSLSAINGLPMFEVRLALEGMGFFDLKK